MIAVNEQRPRRANVIFAPEYIPICPTHRCDMTAYSRRRTIVYFHCPHATCACADKVARKLFVVKRPGAE